MNISTHTEYRRVAAAARRLFNSGAGVRFQGTVFRAAHPRYSELPDLISGDGSRLNGSRWNAPGTMRVLHASDSPETAVSEYLVIYRHFRIPVPSDLHIVIRAIHVDVRRLLDLREGEVRQAIRVSEQRLLSAGWQQENAAGHEAVSQAVGRAAAAAGFGGLVAPSAAVQGAINLVIFVDCLAPEERLALGSAE